ncbi:hypothetical protein CDD80_4013 [Ophiocordyceps camponoti-rufipedis]|uniref:Uncharacterized protein n=1 Tax=Ophiocordyceps camponoti-rufipedis TaxID=2004952 RepID=A0A2C5XI19_9HYPO|nr:hypothetical protein CDD80_4013 [Ophiocordyceps camponoti-rufipedis]
MPAVPEPNGLLHDTGSTTAPEPIAIVGMAMRLPGGQVGTLSMHQGYFLQDVDFDEVDPTSFSGPRSELKVVDPQQRLLLEVAYECMENAGATRWQGTNIGCFVATYIEDWQELLAKDTLITDTYTSKGQDPMMLANRLSYEYDLRGPRMGVLSPFGCCKSFDASADGFGRGEAINAIYVKTLSRAIKDGDSIRAVVRGTTVGSDGWTKAISIPNGEQHEVMMRRAYQQAGIADLSETAFIECHGTGTSVGDPIETNAIAKCVGSKGMLLTSVKPNVGHGEGAAGLTSVIKAVLALEHRLVPPNIFFKTPNPKIPFEEAKLRVPVETEQWPEGRAERVSVNSFGIGGTNAHAILESLHQYRTGKPNTHADSNGTHGDGDGDGSKPHLLLFSALSETSVMTSAKKHIDYLQNSGALAKDVAYTLAHRRDHKTHRTYAIVDGKFPPEAPASVAAKSAPVMGWVFTGQGAQWPGMGAELMRSNAVFTRTIGRLDRFLVGLPSPPSWTIAGELGKSAAASRVSSSELSSALCTAIQIGLVDVLRSWNMQPDFVVGHSVVSYFRGLSMPAKKGSMAALGLGRSQVSPLLEPGVVVACENSQSSVTISGDSNQVDKVLRRVREEHPVVLARLLRVETAFHSEHVHENSASYEKSIRPYIDSQPPKTAFYSSLTGERFSDDQRLGPWYWRANMEQPVLFNSALRSALSDHRARVFMTEIGPHPALQGPINQILRAMGRVDDVHAASLRRGQACERSLLELAGNMFHHSVPGLQLAAVVPAGQFVRGLPPYSWARQPAPLAQPRMAREWRQHQHAPHELLGIRAWELSDEPAWRNKLSVSRSRWLIGHEIQNRILMPAAAYISMIGEALRQLHGHTGYEVRNVSFAAVLLLPVDGEVEIATRLRTVEASQSSAWRGFVISSFDGDTWIQRCRGEARSSSSPLKASLDDASSLVRRIDADGWYESFRRHGLGYSGCFRGLRSITAATTEDTAMATLPQQDTGVWYVMHPASIDHALQLLYLASTRGLGRKLDHLRLPTFVGHIVVHQAAQDQDSMVATARWTEPGGDVVVQQDGKQLLSMLGVEMTLLSYQEEESPPLISRMHWRQHINFCPGESLIKPGTSFSTERALLDELVGLYCVANVETLDLPDSHAQPHLAKLASFIKKRAQGAPRSNQLTREERLAKMEEIYAQGQSTTMPAFFLHAKTVFDASSSILAGSMHLLQAVLDREDDMFHEIYFQMGREANVTDLIQAMAHLNPRLRVLEIGAGSGGFTRAFLDLATSTSSGERSYESYTFTDVSASFLTSAMERFAHYNGIIYDVLDLEKDPAWQGFSLESYHLIVASNVIHATRSVQQSLRHLRSLLRPGGRLLMTELVSDFESVATYLWGPFPGWWLGEADNRPDHPLLSPEQWCKELVTAGFEKPNYVAGSIQATYTASRGWGKLSEMSPTSKDRVSLLCYAPDGPLVDELQVRLESIGVAADIRLFGECMPLSGQTIISLLDVDDRYEPVVHGMDEAAFNTLFGLFRANEMKTVIWLTQPSQVGCRDPRYSMILGMARTMRTEKNARFYTIEVDGEQNSISAATGLLTDLLKTPEMLGPGLDDGDADWEYAVIDGQVLIPRMHWQSLSSALVQSKGNRKDTHTQSAVQLRIQKRGMLKSLTWEMADVQKPGHGEVLIKTKAVGINFLDVAKSLGLVQLGGDKLGIEGSGVVVETGLGVESLSVGDNVFFFSDTGAFSSAVVLAEDFCTRFDDSLTFEQAASLTIVYTTVIKALVHVARLEHGQTLLLHSACGGVGLAAIQVARKLGAEIYCTVGTDAKRRYLTEKLGVSPSHIFGSRDPSFLSDVMRATNNRGVDVVLNSLSGELLQASWNCVAKGGIMVEIGKVDFQQRSNLSMDRFEANRTFAGLELFSLMRENRAELRRLTEQMLEWIREGHIQPVPIAEAWEANQVQQAFRSMQRGNHIGKMVVRMPDDASSLASAATRYRPQPKLRPDGCYLIVGGLGGIGRAVANWLVENGARHLVFLSRSARQGPEVDGFVEELASQGCQARLVAGDVSILADVERAVKTAAEPIKGVLNLAMALEDAAYDNMTFAQWTACVAPKVLGTWNLDSVLASCELDFFILTSSFNGLVGGRGQANYAAASSFLDSFVQYRHGKGLVASVIDLGLVAGIGFASRMTNSHTNFGRLELVPLMEQDVLESINLAMRVLEPASSEPYAAPGQIVAGLITNSKAIRHDELFRKDSRFSFVHGLISATTDSEPRRKTTGVAKDLITLAKQQPSLLQGDEAVKAIADDLVSAFEYMSNRDSGSVDVGHSLAAAGLDSLLAVELRGWLWGEMGVDVPAVVITQSSIIMSAPYWGQLPQPTIAKRNDDFPSARPDGDSLQSTVIGPPAFAAQDLAPGPGNSFPREPVLNSAPRLLPQAYRNDGFLPASPEDCPPSQLGAVGGPSSREPVPEDYDAQYQLQVHAVSARQDVTQPTTAGSRRPRKLANERSPLQRLELTLDSMTKEEKRARVEAAEQRARRRAAMRAAESPNQQVDLVPQLLPVAHTQREAQNQPLYDGGRHHHDPLAQHVADAQLDLPARNLSFRERAVQNEASMSDKEVQSQSWRLTKDPPGGPIHRDTQDAESSLTPNATQASQPKLLPLSSRNKQLPPIPSPSPVTQPPDVSLKQPSRELIKGAGSGQVGDTHTLDGQRTAASAGSRRGLQEPADRGTAAPNNTALVTPERQGSHYAARPMFKVRRDDGRPGQGSGGPPRWLDEWRKATTGTLSGALLDLGHEQPSAVDRNKAWWESGGQARGPVRPPRQPRGEAFAGEYDDANGPSRFRPPLYLHCGPLLRYCGLRREGFLMRPQNGGDVTQREIWRGSVMIVTKDSESSYEIAPMLRLFVQNVELLPPPPQQVDGELPAEYVDPIAGHPKLGRRGETLYVRPVEHIAEGKDLSRNESGGGLFEATRSPPDVPPADGSPEPPGSLARRIRAADADGEKLQKYKDVRGFRLHAERGRTFWRFNIEIELRERQQRIAYRINRGPCGAFWVPARGQTMNIMFYSCNGFSAGARPDELSGPDPLWRDVLNTHQTQPFHVMLGGGNQIYNDCIADESDLLANWLFTRGNDLDRDYSDDEDDDDAFTADMRDELETLYLDRCCTCFSQGLYGLAASQIPMVNMYDDHDVLDVYGSYPHQLLSRPVLRGLGAVAFKYYMLFQHQSLPTETESSEPSWILGHHPGPYINELSRSIFVSLGAKVVLLAVDCRTERTESTVVREMTWEKMMNRLYAEIRRGQMDHLLVVSALPIAFPRFTSRLVSPVKALGRAAVFGSSPGKMLKGDQWTAKAHRRERSIVMEDLQDLAIDKSMRVTILSGNANMAAIGHFYSNPKLNLAKHRDPRYMPNIISSAVANVPPSDKTADVMDKRVKVHHFDKQTDEGMIPLFRHGVDGRPRSNARFLPMRNWCSIRPWEPGHTPPPTPPAGVSQSPAVGSGGGGGISRRLSLRREPVTGRADEAREPVRGSRPPISGLLRSLSRRKSTGAHQPAKLRRSMSLGVGGSKDRGYLGTAWRADDGRRAGEADDGYAALASSLPGTQDEFAAGDDSYFTAKGPRRAQSMGSQGPGRFHRTPTGLSAKQMQQADRYAVDLEGGLEVTINVEVSGRDPAGITVPYRLLVPRLQYEYDPASDDLGSRPEAGGLRRLLSLGRPRPARAKSEASDVSEDYPRR